jgi:ADP-ribosyl-[dinitrogen reductase] hydrolase
MSPASPLSLEQRFAGVLLGTAAGDAVGLPAEGLEAGGIASRWRGGWRHRLVFGRGMISDDTEHAAMVAQSLLEHPGDAAAFQHALARRLRWWLLALPAGVGLATGRSIIKLWLGVPPGRSGVRSAGNGPAMRSAIFGVFFAQDAILRRRFTEVSARLTHTDERAVVAASAVAEIAALVCRGGADGDAPDPLALLQALSADPEWQGLVGTMRSARAEGDDVRRFAGRLGQTEGVSGYAYHTVPVAIYAWLRHRGDFRAALEAALNCGGDTDTVGAITGALAGAEGGERAIPADWLDGIVDWPRSTHWLRGVAARLARQAGSAVPVGPEPMCWPGVPARNFAFLLIVLFHGFARLLPRRR